MENQKDLIAHLTQKKKNEQLHYQPLGIFSSFQPGHLLQNLIALSTSALADQ